MCGNNCSSRFRRQKSDSTKRLSLFPGRQEVRIGPMSGSAPIADDSAGASSLVPGDVQADLTFIVRQDAKPYFESSALTGGEPKVFFKTEQRRVTIRDMRPLASALSLDRQGFVLCHHKTSGHHGWAPQNKCAGDSGGGWWCHRPWRRDPCAARCPSWVLPPPSGPIRGGPPVDLKHVRCRRRATPQLETLARWPGLRREAQACLQGLERPRGSLSHVDVRFGHRGYGSSRLSDSACSPDFKK